MAAGMDQEEYDAYIEQMRQVEYPMLKGSLYLDHAGTTLYSKTLMELFHADMMGNLYGNPHSASLSSQKSTHNIEAIRLQALQYLGADPEVFDLVFTANTTAAIKLIVEAFRAQDGGFWYGYHVDSHTSLVGVRQSAQSHRCFESDEAMEQWLGEESGEQEYARLLAYPAQSNMNGRRLPLNWTQSFRTQGPGRRTFTLLDAAAYASTSTLPLANKDLAPDFTVLSFSKIFGFPDLGALVVKKDCASFFEKRGYFAGGTVDMVACLKEQWHIMKSDSIHDQLEDGTLPVHNILALKSAMGVQVQLFHTLDRIAEHTSNLAKQLYDKLKGLKHGNGRSVCKIYKHARSTYGDVQTQGPLVAFNLQDSQGHWISNFEVEKLAAVKDVHIRTGGLCNPGGVATTLGLAPWEMRENFLAGLRCGGDNDIMNGKPTGVIRASLGAMSTRSDVEKFVGFLDEFFVDKSSSGSTPPSPLALIDSYDSRFYVESLTVYPIKSCSGWQVPYGSRWDIRQEGLAWDREWCIVKQGTGIALSQKTHPRMALIRPALDFREGVLRVTVTGSSEQLTVALSQDPSFFASADIRRCNASVCGDKVEAQLYASPTIADFFTKVIGVPCTLARFPAATQANPSIRHCKAELRKRTVDGSRMPILLSNESPILTISRSSLNRLNEMIKAKGGKAAHPAVFRANIVLAESPLLSPGREQPWAEDYWEGMRIGDGIAFDFLGGCRRCQMVCVDQESGEKNQEPFVTLAKTRRFGGRVLFGVHTALADGGGRRQSPSITVGDVVTTWSKSIEE